MILKNRAGTFLFISQGKWEFFCSFPSLFLCPHRINSRGGSRGGSFVRAAALHPFQMGGSFRIILPSTPPSTAELMRWSRSSAHKQGMGTDLLPLRGKDKHMLQSLFINLNISSVSSHENISVFLFQIPVLEPKLHFRVKQTLSTPLQTTQDSLLLQLLLSPSLAHQQQHWGKWGVTDVL